MSDLKVVKEGRWLYANEVWCVVRIQRVNFWPGTGDAEDSSEIAEDRVGQFFRIEYGSPTEEGRFDGGGYSEELGQAVAMVERVVPAVIWTS